VVDEEVLLDRSMDPSVSVSSGGGWEERRTADEKRDAALGPTV
jgi:hypothetical protein